MESEVKYVRENNLQELEKKVNQMLLEGWGVYGPLMETTHSIHYFIQPMIYTGPKFLTEG